MQEGLLKPGAVLNSTYRIEALVGEGGTGEVYRAVNTASNRTVAIKILKEQFSQDPKFIDLMRRELLHTVSDDAVVRYYDLLRTAEDQGGLYFLVMDFIEGPALSDLMRSGPVDVDTLMVTAKQVTQGLAACHRAKIFHRDISPDNIILRDGDPSKATLIDFGIAKDVTPDAKTVVGGGFAGKYEYAAPEQLDGIADSRSDIYSLGMTLLAAARGESPKLGTSFLEIVKTKHSPVDTAGVGEPLRAIVDAMVRPEPDDRPQTAAELLRMVGGSSEPGIESLLDEESRSAGPAAVPKTVPPAGETRQKGRGGLVAALLALLLLGGGAYFALGPGSGLIGGGLETASPYRMNIGFDGDSTRVSGNAPSAEAAERLVAALSRQLPGEISRDALSAATGAPNDAWVSTVTAMASELAKLESGKLEFRDDQITLSGDANSRSVQSQIERASRIIASNGGYRLALLVEAPEPVALAAADTDTEASQPPATTDRASETGSETAASTEDPDPSAERGPEEPSTSETGTDDPVDTADTSSPEGTTGGGESETPDRSDGSGQVAQAETDEPDAPSEPRSEPGDEPDPSESSEPAGEADPVERAGDEPSTDPEETGEPEEITVAQLPVEPRPTPPAETYLARSTVERALLGAASCGPLSVRSSSSRGFGETETIRITGDLPSDDAEQALRRDIEDIAGDRPVDTSLISILNPSVCMIKNVMPPRNSGPASLLYYSAGSGKLVQGDALEPDDQAVVYFSAPADLDGNLYVFITDNEFNTIHLYPMQTKPETRISEIGTVESGERRIQLSWPMAEGSRQQPVLAFTEPYGISMMFVVLTDEDTELFPHPRAGVEDTRELAPILDERISEARLRGQIVSHIQRFILVDED